MQGKTGAWFLGERPYRGPDATLDRLDPGVWFVGLDAWTIQDGNYGEFAVGEDREFAVEFFAQDELQKVKASAGRTRHIEDDTYAVDGEVLAVTEDLKWWVLGLEGLAAYRNDEPPKGAEKGSFLKGVVRLGVDPFFYFERGNRRNDLPALIYSWRIRQIFIQTAPYVEVRPKQFSRDLSAWKWRSIPATDAWNDDDGYASYLFECELMSPTPQFSRTRR